MNKCLKSSSIVRCAGGGGGGESLPIVLELLMWSESELKSQEITSDHNDVSTKYYYSNNW